MKIATIRGASALLVTAGLAVGCLTGLSTPAAAAGAGNAAAAQAGAQYLVGQLVEGNHLASAYGPDYGLTADLAIALAAAGSQQDSLAKVVGYERAHVVDYADPAGTTSYPGPYSGAVGKLALLAEVTGQDPTSFGGFDLLATLTSHVCTAADAAGNCTAAGDFYQAFSSVSQSLAITALARKGVAVPPSTVTRLEQLQCSDGGFTSELLTAGGTCTSDPDATSFAMQALSLVPGTAGPLGQATNYLLGSQQSDGGYLGTAGENVQSTALAGQALLAVDPSGASSMAAVAKAVAFELTLHNSDGGFGLRASKPASDGRTTTQAVPSMAGATLTTVTDPIVAVTPTTAPASSSPARSTPASRPSSASASTSGSTSAGAVSSISAASGTGAELAATGAAPVRVIWLAALLLLLGSLALGWSYRGRPVPATARARAASRRH